MSISVKNNAGFQTKFEKNRGTCRCRGVLTILLLIFTMITIAMTLLYVGMHRDALPMERSKIDPPASSLQRLSPAVSTAIKNATTILTSVHQPPTVLHTTIRSKPPPSKATHHIHLIDNSEHIPGIDLHPLHSYTPHLLPNSSDPSTTQFPQELILGLAADTDPKYLAIFCGSLRKVNPLALVIIFMNKPILPRNKLIAKENNITLLPYEVHALQPDYLRKYHPSTLRWILYDQLFNLRHDHGYFGDSLKKIIALDVRDVAFQRDPFTLFAENDKKMLVFG